jgi:putative transposase
MRPATASYARHRYPKSIIAHAAWLYHRFSLSFRDVEDLLAQRGVEVSYETIRRWCDKFGPTYAAAAKRRNPRRGDIWFLDEVFTKIAGRRQYLWRAVDQDGDVIGVLVQAKRDARAAKKFLRKLLRDQGVVPNLLVTDKLGSYRAARRTMIPSVPHDTTQYANNRAEVSHQPTRQRERQMRGFRSVGSTQRFLSVHGVVQNLFRFGRHLLRAAHARLFRKRAFSEWSMATCVW